MDLSLQAIDFLFASSIQDGWPLSDIGGDDEGDEDGGTFLRSHLSSRGLSGTLVGHDSIRKKTVISPVQCLYICTYCVSTHLQVCLLAFPLVLCLCSEERVLPVQGIHLMSAPLFELSSRPPGENCELDHLNNQENNLMIFCT